MSNDDCRLMGHSPWPSSQTVLMTISVTGVVSTHARGGEDARNAEGGRYNLID